MNSFHSLAPSLLISMPQLNDPHFDHSVVLLCEHGKDGAFGLILNKPTDQLASEVVRMTPPISGTSDLGLWIGGPVAPERGWILVGDSPGDAESVQVSPGVFLSAVPSVLRRCLEASPSPRTRLLTGCAGWTTGQLDAEVASSSWLISDVDAELVFDVPSSTLWEEAIRRIGADPLSLQVGGGSVH